MFNKKLVLFFVFVVQYKQDGGVKQGKGLVLSSIVVKKIKLQVDLAKRRFVALSISLTSLVRRTNSFAVNANMAAIDTLFNPDWTIGLCRRLDASGTQFVRAFSFSTI